MILHKINNQQQTLIVRIPITRILKIIIHIVSTYDSKYAKDDHAQNLEKPISLAWGYGLAKNDNFDRSTTKTINMRNISF